MIRTNPIRTGLAALAAGVILPGAVQAAPDLQVSVQSVTPTPAKAGDRVMVRTLIRNGGRSAVNLSLRSGNRTRHIVRWFYVERGKRDKFVLAMSELGKLAPRQRKTLNQRIKIPDTARPGRRQICAVIDPTNGIRESNERNNRGCIAITVRPKSGRIAQAPGLKPQLQPGIRPDLRPDIRPAPGTLRPRPGGNGGKQCRNPAITELQVGILRKDPRNRFQGTIQLKAVLKNVGNADYVTKPNQQTVQIYFGSRLIKNERFGNLRRGEVRIISASLPWNAAGEFQGNLKAQIVYDPDIRIDGNPRNDDCNMRDNSKTLAPQRANRLFTG